MKKAAKSVSQFILDFASPKVRGTKCKTKMFTIQSQYRLWNQPWRSSQNQKVCETMKFANLKVRETTILTFHDTTSPFVTNISTFYDPYLPLGQTSAANTFASMGNKLTFRDTHRLLWHKASHGTYSSCITNICLSWHTIALKWHKNK